MRTIKNPKHLDMKKQELIEERSIEFENDMDIMEVRFLEMESRNSWANPFMIILNCKCVGSFKTFKGLENKVNRLISERGLTRVND